jgi:hypothetical protein
MRVSYLRMVGVVGGAALACAAPSFGATISSFAPAFGLLQAAPCQGGVITITGSGFVNDGPPVSVSFNGVAAAWMNVGSDTTIYAIPAAGTTSGPITVTTAKGSTTSASMFYPYQCWGSETDTTPTTVFAVTPSKIKPGGKITIHGSAFTGASSVTIGAVKTTFSVSSSQVIVATVPSSAKAGSGIVTVTTPTGTASSLTNIKIT